MRNVCHHVPNVVTDPSASPTAQVKMGQPATFESTKFGLSHALSVL